jgi:hypothetical protein
MDVREGGFRVALTSCGGAKEGGSHDITTPFPATLAGRADAGGGYKVLDARPLSHNLGAYSQLLPHFTAVIRLTGAFGGSEGAFRCVCEIFRPSLNPRNSTP